MSSDPYSSLTPEELALLPHDNRTPQFLASIWSLAGVASAFLCLRIYCRMLKSRQLWWDDAILIASWVGTYTYIHTSCLIQGLLIWELEGLYDDRDGSPDVHVDPRLWNTHLGH
jgi:hypothetical protein